MSTTKAKPTRSEADTFTAATWTGVDVASPAIHETDTAVVVAVGDRVYKIKKAVDLGDVDLTSLAARAGAADAEVSLNRRFAPDVYLGTLDIVDHLGDLCEHMVVMRRLPADRRLSALVERGADVASSIDCVADIMAAVHGRAERVERMDAACTAEDLRRRWQKLLDELSADVETLGRRAIDRCAELATAYLDDNAPLFDQRIERGFVKEGHGDLVADDIFCTDDGPRILDCLDLDAVRRRIDVLADLASLAMDLEQLGRPDLARRLLDRYGDVSGATWPRSLEHHHIALSATDRAAAAAARAHRTPVRATTSAELARSCDYLHLAVRHLVAAQPQHDADDDVINLR